MERDKRDIVDLVIQYIAKVIGNIGWILRICERVYACPAPPGA